MKQRPILFSVAMVQAILAGRKTQTRRTIKSHLDDRGLRWGPGGWEDWHGAAVKCPYGQPGDILWVREEHYRFGHWVGNGKTKTGRQKWKFVPDTEEVRYFDDAPPHFRVSRDKKFPHAPDWYKRLARFMPKHSCRIFLQVTDIRVERLQDITEDDAINEGVESFGYVPDQTLYRDYLRRHPESRGFNKAARSFQSLWKKINCQHSWEANPWVWVVCFEKNDKPE